MAVNGSVSEDSLEGTEDPADDDVDEADRGRSGGADSGSKKSGGRLPIVVIGVVVLAAVAAAAIVLSSRSSKPKAGPPANPAGPTLTTFVDQKDGFSLSYPSTWLVGKATTPDVPLSVSFGASGLDTLLVRLVQMEGLINTNNVANIKAFTDAVISGEKVTVLKQQAITVNGLPGYYYFYSLPPAEGVTLVHSHLFVFLPHEMVSLMFQTLDSDFTPLASTFDQVVASIRTTPAP